MIYDRVSTGTYRLVYVTYYPEVALLCTHYGTTVVCKAELFTSYFLSKKQSQVKRCRGAQGEQESIRTAGNFVLPRPTTTKQHNNNIITSLL